MSEKKIKTCEFCGKEFETADKRKIYCSAECRGKAGNKRAAEQRKSIPYAPKKEKEKVKKIGIENENAKARELHMSYGKFKALQYMEMMRGEEI